MESPYPNFTERIVASTLLLLSSSPSVDRCESLLLNKSFSRSSASSIVSSDDVSSDEAHARRHRTVANAVARSEHAMKLKVVRKSRSKTLWISDSRRTANAERKFVTASCSSSLTSEGSSCLSGGSSSLVSSSESCKSKMMRENMKPSSSVVGSAHLLRRSEAILKVLAHIGCASEVRIRQLLGDSPDTSKALRMLLKKEEVRRSGAGGRGDPFIYQVIIPLINKLGFKSD
ncbi:hypothetical protein HanXRQr2_Chr06g0257171 [Helianthus annuus]|uniref:HTH three-helical bundle domain-containing protein n=1 Tax=Helianthus annuus TaxID=4232 RepID=A0A9K3ISK9_HELAN|nr:hypothetical protein HanXRQr2_Chr06g0257171 [Helianthus annuus]KAJ0573415.1 hypothetical protein HanHA89_Chr06g0226501 [Helianthus annuus]KAJ0740679.1 hypothetical protein HanOQP8_Chr06g0219481 [Helianthus annuus]KAJ0915287.1 hypothetical protein HanPSC8_Chr06g0248171 [Helianthus annuus]